MARIALVAPLALGHLNPMLAVARALSARGHDCTFVHMADGEAWAARRGLAYRTVGRTTHPSGFIDGLGERPDRILPRVLTPWNVRRVPRLAAGITAMLCRELPGALRALGTDLILCDQIEAAGGLVADHLGLPHVSLASALPINSEPSLPPLFLPWRYDPSPFGLRRNRVGTEAVRWAIRPVEDVIADTAARWRLGPRRRVDHCLSFRLQILQIVPRLDFPRRHLWPVAHHCGPLRSGAEVAGPMPMIARDGRPLAYASLGSGQGWRFGLIRRISEAARRAGLQLVLTHGGGLSPEQAARLPGAPSVHAFLPQAEILREAAVAVLHGGLNTVLDACGAGVPLVLAPLAFEQGAIARRVERAGAGTGLAHRLTGAAGFAAAIGRVRGEPGFRQAAGHLAREIAASGGATRAADLIEQLLRTGRPVLAAPLPVPERLAA